MKTRGYLAVLVAVVLWGCTYLLLDALLRRFPPSELIAVRFTGSLLITLMVFGRSMRRHRQDPSQIDSKSERNSGVGSLSPMTIAVLAGFALAGATFMQKYGILKRHAVYAAFVSALAAVCIPFLQKLLGDAVSLKRVMVPVGLAAAGTAMLVSWKLPTSGDVLLLAAAVSYGLQAVLVGKIKTRIHYATAHAAACACCVVTAVPFLLSLDKGNVVAPSTAPEWIGMAALTVLSTFVPWNLVHYAQQFSDLDAYRVGQLYTLEPVVTAGLGIPFHLAQQLPIISVIGCLLIVGANERMARLDAN